MGVLSTGVAARTIGACTDGWDCTAGTGAGVDDLDTKSEGAAGSRSRTASQVHQTKCRAPARNRVYRSASQTSAVAAAACQRVFNTAPRTAAEAEFKLFIARPP